MHVHALERMNWDIQYELGQVYRTLILLNHNCVEMPQDLRNGSGTVKGHEYKAEVDR